MLPNCEQYAIDIKQSASAGKYGISPTYSPNDNCIKLCIIEKSFLFIEDISLFKNPKRLTRSGHVSRWLT